MGLPQPLSRKRVCPPPPDQRVWEVTLACGVGSPNYDDWKKTLSLCLLCDWETYSTVRDCAVQYGSLKSSIHPPPPRALNPCLALLYRYRIYMQDRQKYIGYMNTQQYSQLHTDLPPFIAYP